MAKLTDDVIIGDMSFKSLGLVLKHFEDVPPDAKIEVIDIPFGENVDVTNAFGDTAFSNRTHKFEWLAINVGDGHDDFMQFVSSLSAKVHGVRTAYKLSFDPDYTYVGRWSIKSYEWHGNGFGSISMEVDVSPWKIKGHVVDTFCAYPPVIREYMNGRKFARPVVTTFVDTTVVSNGKSSNFKPGKHTSSNFMLYTGKNTAKFTATGSFKWSVGENATLHIDDQSINYDPSTQTVTIADELIEQFANSTLTLNNSAPIVTVEYDWKDL